MLEQPPVRWLHAVRSCLVCRPCLAHGLALAVVRQTTAHVLDAAALGVAAAVQHGAQVCQLFAQLGLLDADKPTRLKDTDGGLGVTGLLVRRYVVSGGLVLELLQRFRCWPFDGLGPSVGVTLTIRLFGAGQVRSYVLVLRSGLARHW